MKSKSFLITGAVVAAIAMCGPVTAFAASKKASASPSPSPAASASSTASASPAKAPRAIPFRGTVSEVDQNAKTFTIQGKEKSRVFKVTDNSKVTKAGAAATFTDITANEAVTGSYWKQADGSLECKSVKVGGAGAQTSTKKSKSDKNASASPSPSASPKK